MLIYFGLGVIAWAEWVIARIRRQGGINILLVQYVAPPLYKAFLISEDCLARGIAR